jgi:hypothetical protein
VKLKAEKKFKIDNKYREIKQKEYETLFRPERTNQNDFSLPEAYSALLSCIILFAE